MLLKFSLFNGFSKSCTIGNNINNNNNNLHNGSRENTSGRDSAVSELGTDSCSSSLSCWPTPEHQPKITAERRRRRLPEIPKKRCEFIFIVLDVLSLSIHPPLISFKIHVHQFDDPSSGLMDCSEWITSLERDLEFQLN